MKGYMNREAYVPTKAEIKAIACPGQKIIWNNTAAEPNAKIILLIPPDRELNAEYQLPMNRRKKQ